MKKLTKLVEKRLLKNLVKASQDFHDENPHVKGNMFNALRNVQSSHLLDASLFDVLTESAKVSEGPDAHLLRLRNEFVKRKITGRLTDPRMLVDRE